MIKSISIERFRGIRDGRLEDLTPLTVLVGPNGSGKSSVLDALLVANDDLPAEAVRHVGDRRFGGIAPERWIFYRADQTAGAKLLARREGIEEREVEIVRKPGDRQVCVSATGVDAAGGRIERSPVLLRFGPKTKDEKASSQSALFGSAAPVPGDSAIRLVQPDRPELEHELPVLYTRALESGRSEEVVAQVGALTGATDVRIGAPGGESVLYLVFPDHAIPAKAAGDGIQALLLLSLELAVRDGNTILLEEPEAHLHPAAILQCSRAILTAVRRHVQVVLSTHSLELIDSLVELTSSDEELGILSVYRLNLRAGELIHSRIAGSEVAFVRATIAEDLR